MPPLRPREARAADSTATNIVRAAYDPDDPDRVHITPVNQELGSLFSSEPGEEVIPFPFAFQGDGEDTPGTSMDDGFLASLRNPIEVHDGDAESKLEWKRNILEARLSLLDGIKKGISVKDAIRDEYTFRVRAYEARSAYLRDLQAYAAENPDAAAFKKTLSDVNAQLAREGIKKISMDDVDIENIKESSRQEQPNEEKTP